MSACIMRPAARSGWMYSRVVSSPAWGLFNHKLSLSASHLTMDTEQERPVRKTSQ